MDYPALIKRLSHRGVFRIKPGLHRTREILDVLGNPQERIPTLHIAGTNGKGSVAVLLESVLRQAGYRTGLYTSPHLHDVRERLQINRQPIPIPRFWGTAQSILDAEQKVGFTLTYFEFLTVMAFVSFAKESIDVSIIETGMGGRWDATNVVKQPCLTFITSIGLEHTQWLGKTERAIAREKAGIIKTGCDVISGARGKTASVIRVIARKMNSPIYHIDKNFRANLKTVDWKNNRQLIEYHGISQSRRNLEVGLLGSYQVDNAALASAGIDLLVKKNWHIPVEAVTRGMAQASWPGRFQIHRGLGGQTIILDGAHNPPAIRRLLETLEQSPWKKAFKTFVFGVYRDKDYGQMIRLLEKYADQLIICTLPGTRSLPAGKILRTIQRATHPTVLAPNPHKALQKAIEKTTKNNLIVVTGSLALVGMLTEDLAAEARIPAQKINETLQAYA